MMPRASCTEGCEKEVADATTGASDEGKNESIMRLSWALVHSKQPQDVQRGIAMLQASLANSSSPLQQREKLYLLAVGFYRSGEYSRSRELTDQCLEIAPDWRQALSLKKAIEDRITKGNDLKLLSLLARFCIPPYQNRIHLCLCNADGVIGIGITLITIGLIAGGIVASLVRRK
ncbi:Mitochondrial fission 1 protein A [Capsicum baccatum]|uniref:Mitochondrial fission 1 protein A n=1 Tax=Capsicum baccatum TaxID=33114 RepID=A0A2G2VW98_CAPBA|nr:Mitochondrial fission 1 protein A [Capsicum baccatum]